MIVGLAFFVRSQSESEKFRSEAFSVMLVVALLVLEWAVLNARFVERRTPDPFADRLGGRLIVAGIVAIVIGMTVKLLFTTADEIAAGISPAKFSMRIRVVHRLRRGRDVGAWRAPASDRGRLPWAATRKPPARSVSRPPARRRSCS